MIGSKVNFQSASGATDYVINDRASIDSNWTQAPHYYIQITSVDGLYGSDISYESDPLPNQTGEISGDVIRRGKGVTISGRIWADNLTYLENASQFLQHMFWETEPRKLIWWPLNRNRTVPTEAVYLTARVNNDLVISQTLDNFNTNTPPNWNWQVGLRADDPRIYNVVDDTIYENWQT